MTVHELLVQYEGRMRELHAALLAARFHGILAAIALAIAVSFFLTLGVLAIRQQVSLLWPFFPVPLATVAALRFQHYRQSQSRAYRLKRFYDRAVRRLQGRWAGHGPSGDEFCSPDHIYAKDLNVFGEGSLFELLCTARTAIGQRGLAQYLLKAPDVVETRRRQDAVQELQGQTGLRERVAALGEFEFSESKWETFAELLDLPPVSFPVALRIAALLTSSLLSLLLLTGLTGMLPWIKIALFAAPLVLFHSTVGLLFRKRVNRMLTWVRPVSGEIRVLREGLQLLETRPFHSEKLTQLVGLVQNSSKSVRKLERLLLAHNERAKDFFYGPSLLLLLGTQLYMAIEQWRIEHGLELREWLDAWAEFEALSSLANYAYENPGNPFPQISEEETVFAAEALGHPLIPGESCVRNDVHLDQESRFYVISGSNMSGKSTLLRAMGLNAVLALAGAPVRAHSLRLSRLAVCASISVVDSLLNGKSKFLAEVDRLRQTIEAAARGEQVLFLIDEIFAGTNSRDRRIATEAVVRILVDRGAIGALSTHDLALSELAGPELHGVNVHTGSRDGAGPLDFDYALKPGVTTEANALAIARMAGVPI